MKANFFLCLALLGSVGVCAFPGMTRAEGTNTDLSGTTMVNPQLVPLSGTTSAIFQEQASDFSVQVPIGYSKAGRDIVDTNVAQVWLLKTDGTSVPRSGQPSWISLSTVGSFSEDYEFYVFQKVPINEMAGVVVSYNGKLYCHEIQKAKKPLTP